MPSRLQASIFHFVPRSTFQVGPHCRLIWVGWRDTADASPLTSKTTCVSYRLEKRKQEDVRMTNTLICNLLKSLAAFVITASFSSASFAGEFTVHQGNRYRATLSLNSVERLADNALIARKFRALGFSHVRVSGTGTIRRVEGVWPRKDASAPLPPSDCCGG